MKLFTPWSLLVAILLANTNAWAEDVHVAVASNFIKPMEKIAADFEQATGNKVLVSAGASGKLVEQMKHGAPFDVFLSADQTNPIKLEKESLDVPGSRFTYAIGKLVLWSAQPRFVDDKGAILKTGSAFQHIAVADPKTAPYGKAAVTAMENLGILETLKPRIVQGDSIAQTQAFVSSGNAELGFVALSQVIKDGSGSSWLVPQDLYDPVYQDAILLKTGENNAAAKALLDYLKTAPAHALIKEYGYDLPSWTATDAD